MKLSKKTLKELSTYLSENYKPYLLRFNKEKDIDIINKLNSVESPMKYIRGLINADIRRNKRNINK